MATAAGGDAADGVPELPPEEDSGADADGSEYEEDDDEEEEGDQYVVLKFLLSTEAAGSVIGKNGATVSELQAQSGTKIQLSKACAAPTPIPHALCALRLSYDRPRISPAVDPWCRWPPAATGESFYARQG